MAKPEPGLPCPICGSGRHYFSFRRFPPGGMRWSARCANCSFTRRCSIKPSPPRPKPPDAGRYDGWPPIWY